MNAPVLTPDRPPRRVETWAVMLPVKVTREGMAAIRAAATAQRMTVSDYVREAIRFKMEAGQKEK